MLGPIVGPGLRVLFVGINPSLRSAQVGHHFARPGNRFWPTLHAAGFTPRLLRPEEDNELPALGIGVTNIADRPTRAADELSAAELHAGAAELERVVALHAPRLVAVVGVTAYRTAFGRPRAAMGLQPETIGGRPVWVLPNPSGLNAHYKPADFARLYAEAWAYADALPDAAAREPEGHRARTPRQRRRLPASRPVGEANVHDMTKSSAENGESPSQLIDARIEELGDWRGKTLSRVRALIKQADPEVVEEWKWRKATNPGVPVWYHQGGICTGETYKSVVKLTFFKGASLEDPSGLFNSSLEGNTRRAIDFHEDDEIDEKAFANLIRAAVSLNESSAR